MQKLKEMEALGYTYENADGSFELLALDTLGRRPSFRVRLAQTGLPLLQQFFHGYASFHWASMRIIQSRTSMP